MADSSLSYTDTSSSGGIRTIAVAAGAIHRDGLDEPGDFDEADGYDRASTMFEYNLMRRQLNSNNSQKFYIATPAGTPQGTPGTKFLLPTEPIPAMPLCGSERDIRSRSGSREPREMGPTSASSSPGGKVTTPASCPNSVGSVRASIRDARRRPPIRTKSTDAVTGTITRSDGFTMPFDYVVKMLYRDFYCGRSITVRSRVQPDPSLATKSVKFDDVEDSENVDNGSDVTGPDDDRTLDEDSRNHQKVRKAPLITGNKMNIESRLLMNVIHQSGPNDIANAPGLDLPSIHRNASTGGIRVRDPPPMMKHIPSRGEAGE